MNRRPDVLFYCDAPTFGGAETALGTLLEVLDPKLNVAVAGVDPEVLERLTAYRPAARFHRMTAVRSKVDLMGFMAMGREIAKLRPRIFHANLAGPSSAQHALAACTLISQVRTVAVEQLPYALRSGTQFRLKRYNSRRLAAHIAVGRQGARDVERLFELAPGTVRTIHNGVPETELRPMPRPFSSGPILGSVGRLDPQKGFDVLLRALAGVPGASLVIVGDGDERPVLEQMVADLDLSDRVLFAGYRERWRDYLTAIDAFVVPSRFEGLPLVIIDAMLAGLPVVATDVGSISDAVLDGETGRLVPSDDVATLARVLRELVSGSPDQLREMGSRGRSWAGEFSPESMARKYELLYEEILRGQPQRRSVNAATTSS